MTLFCFQAKNGKLDRGSQDKSRRISKSAKGSSNRRLTNGSIPGRASKALTNGEEDSEEEEEEEEEKGERKKSVGNTNNKSKPSGRVSATGTI
jgi:hypothetical protein